MAVQALLASLLLAASWSTAPAAAFNFTPAPAPSLSLDALGRVAFAGDFDSVSLYQFVGQTEQPASSNGALLSRFPNGVFATLNNTDADIRAMCPFNANGSFKGIVLGGNFTSIGNTHTPAGLALVDPNTAQVTPWPGLNGSVNALYCDDKAGQVYVGGSFTGDGANNAIVWGADLIKLPFAGFNGPVYSITKASNDHIIFGGKFNGLGNNSATVEKDSQVLPLSSANISAQTSSGTPGFTDPKSIICKTGDQDGSGNTWLLADNTAGFWQAGFGFGFEPSKLRLFNTKFQGRGTKTWRYTALPNGGIMNLSYTDPQTGQTAFCDARCPLPQNNVSAQDFRFVNTVGMNSFRIDISDWYGNGGGLAGIEIFENDTYAFAINDFNEPTCDGVSTGASSTKTGTAWVTTPSGQSNADYLSATLVGSNISPDSATVVFKPNLSQSGNYSVTVFTPGCISDNTCSTRGRVNVTGAMSSTLSANNALSTQLFQSNNFDKYDQVYYGFIEVTDSFKPSVTLAPMAGQNGPLTVAAQRVRFELLTPSSGNLNGLFDFDPSQHNADTNLDKSAFNTAGASLSPNDQAVITSLAVDGDTTYVAGGFTTSGGLNNIFSIGDGNATALPGQGLNNQVLAMYQNGSTIYVGGNFTNTHDGKSSGLNGVAAYSASDNKWNPLGAGVNGVVMWLVPFTLNITANSPEPVLAVSGFFDSVNAVGSNASFAASGIAVWVPSRKNWLQNVDAATMSIQGALMAAADVPNSAPLFSGSVSSQALGAADAFLLDSSKSLSLQPFSIHMQPQQPQSSLSKRDTAVSDNQTGVLTAVFYHQNGMNTTVLGGRFTATGSDGSNITNLMFIDSKKSEAVRGLPSGVDANSTFLALGTLDDVVFAGGAVTGTVNGNRVAGLVAYDLDASSYVGTQPPGLVGPDVVVQSVAVRPKSKDVFVGGSFESAGALSCPAVCIWNTDRNQWAAPADGISGSVTQMTWVSNTQLLITGNLTVGPNKTTVATFDSHKNAFQSFPGADSLPGPVTAACPADGGGSQVWASGTGSDGTAFVQLFNGKRWLPTVDGLGAGTTVRGVQVLAVSNSHGKDDDIDQKHDLLLLGQLNITGFGSASGALYNGSRVQPFLLTSSQGGKSSLAQVFVENPQSFFGNGEHHLAVGWVVLISMGLALACTFLVVLLGILLEFYRKKNRGYERAPSSYFEHAANMGRVPPERLFSSLNARTRPPAV